MHDDMINIGMIIKKARESKGKTQAELCQMAGISIRTIIDIEKDKHLPSLENLYRIVRALDIPAERIFRPDKTGYSPELEQLMRALQACGEREQKVFLEIAWAYIRAVTAAAR